MKRILSFILSINLIFILVPGTVLAAPSWPSAVSIEADGGILMEAQTGTVLFAKNEDQPYYPASITKILTALIVLEHCSLDEEPSPMMMFTMWKQAAVQQVLTKEMSLRSVTACTPLCWLLPTKVQMPLPAT